MIYDYFSNIASAAIKIINEKNIQTINFDKNVKFEMNKSNIESNLRNIINRSRSLKSDFKIKYHNVKFSDISYIYNYTINLKFCYYLKFYFLFNFEYTYIY